MPANKQVPPEDPCRDAGTRICQLLRGEGESLQGDEKLSLAILCLAISACKLKGRKGFTDFVKKTHKIVSQEKKWMKDKFFKENGFPEAIRSRIQDLNNTKASRALDGNESKQLEHLENSPWLKEGE